MGRITQLMVDTVTISNRTGVADISGDPSYGAQSTVKCRFEFGKRLVIGTEGNEQQSDSVIITETEISRDARVWPPGSDVTKVSESRRVITTKNAGIPRDGYRIFETFL